MHIFLLCDACVYVCISAGYINAHIYYISGVYSLSFYVLCFNDPWMEGIKGGEHLFLIFPLWCCLVSIMAIMKPHLSPSQHNLIIHNGGAVAWNEDECVLFKGQSYMCVHKHKDV